MNSSDVILTVKNMQDIDNITDNIKYINLCIDSVDKDVIDYFLLHGSSYLYSDCINSKCGFIYANYDMFKEGELIINNIMTNMPDNLNIIEKIRYIYISLGKILNSDINVMQDKNEIISFNYISNINNIWASLAKKKVNDIIASKIFIYVCFRMGIKCELINSSISGNIACKVYTDNSFLIVDLYSDLCNIQGGFSTKYFDKYNENKDIDMKISYIDDNYMDYYLDGLLKNNTYDRDNAAYEILLATSSIIDINSIGTYELYQIYKNIFSKYIPSYDVKINNLFISSDLGVRSHFTLFSYNNNYYSYNYNSRKFVSMEYDFLHNNIKKNKIGIYDDENFELMKKGVVL